MPEPLDRGDRQLLIGAGILLVGLVAVSAFLAPPQVSGETLLPSSYSPSWYGAKGAFLLLQELGYRVERWEKSPAEIAGDASHEVLILAEPAQSPREEERFAVREFLERGGRVLATGRSAGQFLPNASDYQEGPPFAEPQLYKSEAASPLAKDAPEITMVAPSGWEPGASQTVVYGDDTTAAVVTYPVGSGQVIWWAAATPLTNGAIRDAGNLALFLNSVGSAENRQVLWDEYFHGAQDSLWSYFARTPVPWSLLQIGLVFAAVLASDGRRNAPARSRPAASRLSPLEFVETLGDLYRSGHASSVAVQTAYQHLRFLLLRQLGLLANTPTGELASAAAQQLGYEEAPLRITLLDAEQATHTRNVSVGDALDLMQRLFDYAARLEPQALRSPQGARR